MKYIEHIVKELSQSDEPGVQRCIRCGEIIIDHRQKNKHAPGFAAGAVYVSEDKKSIVIFKHLPHCEFRLCKNIPA